MTEAVAPSGAAEKFNQNGLLFLFLVFLHHHSYNAGTTKNSYNCKRSDSHNNSSRDNTIACIQVTSCKVFRSDCSVNLCGICIGFNIYNRSGCCVCCGFVIFCILCYSVCSIFCKTLDCNLLSMLQIEFLCCLSSTVCCNRCNVCLSSICINCSCVCFGCSICLINNNIVFCIRLSLVNIQSKLEVLITGSLVTSNLLQ